MISPAAKKKLKLLGIIGLFMVTTGLGCKFVTAPEKELLEPVVLNWWGVVDNADDFWSQDFSSTSPEEAQEIEQLEGAYNTNKKTLEEDLTVRPGMLNTATQEKTVLPPETAKLLKEGVVTSFSNGQKWTLKRGQPVQVQ